MKGRTKCCRIFFVSFLGVIVLLQIHSIIQPDNLYEGVNRFTLQLNDGFRVCCGRFVFTYT